MRDIRCHIDHPLETGKQITLPEEQRRHIQKVLRLTAGQVITLFNGDGYDYLATLTTVSTTQASVTIQEKRINACESLLRITLYQALLKSDKMEWVLQKATELGVAAVVPMVTEFSDARIKPERWPQKKSRWQRIVISASTQSERASVPHIHDPMAVDQIKLNNAPSIALHPRMASKNDCDDGQTGLHGCLPPTVTNMNLLVGPEGGFSNHDIRMMNEQGARCVSLGKRIMRAETAPIAAIAIIQHLYGDLAASNA